MNEDQCPDKLNSPIFEAFSSSIDKQYIYICDVKTNIWKWSPFSVEYFDLPGEIIEDLPKIWLNKVHPEDQARLAQVFEELFSGTSREHSCEYRVMNSAGDYVWVLCRGCMVYDDDGNMDICAGVITNLGQHNKYDYITGLYSVYEFQRVLARVKEEESAKGGILLIGVDYFRRINESKSYTYGNWVLKEYAQKLLENLPERTILFRMNGDQFAFLCPAAEKAELKALFQKAAAIAQKGLLVDGEYLSFTVSGGAVLYPDHGNSADELYTSLEYALEYAKKNNREGITFFSKKLLQETVKSFHFQQKLKESIENDFQGFYLCYQPTVTADAEHNLIGAEALLRWFHPEFGFVSPASFIPVLETSGKIIEVGKWVLSQALRQVKNWLVYKPDMRISVNVSLIQFMNTGFRQYVLDEIAAVDFPKEQLILELTESCSILHPEKAQEELNFYRENGIQIALDDFGTGYSSLSVLRDVTADWIKVDHSFVAQIAESDFDQALTGSLIDLCKKLKLNVCVEGIETEEIREIVQNYEPTLLQGYLFSKPLDCRQFEERYIRASGDREYLQRVK